MNEKREPTRPLVSVVESLEALSTMVAAEVVSCAADAIRQRGRFVVALSGGSTPRELFKLIATPEYSSRFEWQHVQVCWGDERCVPPHDAQSNHRMASEVLLDHVPIPARNVHRIRGEDPPALAAAEYETELRTLFAGTAGAENGFPMFDLMLLGVGTDGHTASLFPGGAALQERARWVAADYSASAGMWRITLTLPVINASRRVLLLVAGADKADVVRHVFVTPNEGERLPAQLIVPSSGVAHWVVDRAAMSKTPGSAAVTATSR